MKKPSIKSFEEAVAYLDDMPRFTSKNPMEGTKNFMDRLGHPDRGMHIIHVAGTNGKGSVCAYMRAVLEEAGKSVCVFTSPHLVDIRERFRIRGELVSKEAFLGAFLDILELLDWEALEKGTGYHPTFFEYLFFMAMILFKKAHTDYCILEVGLGGMLDATNSVEHKELSVITRIGLDHVEYLGDTVEKIAAQKAGIMMEDVPVVYLDGGNEAAGVFARQAEKIGAKAYPVSKNDYVFLNFRNKSIDFLLHTLYYGDIKLKIHTIARYQLENVAVAVRALEVLDRAESINRNALVRGVEECFWQGRMEEIRPGIFLDGAHNDDGIRAFLETVREDGTKRGRTLLFGVVSDKDCVHMIARIVHSGLFEKIFVVHMRTKRSADTESLKSIFDGCGYDGEVRIFENSQAAWNELSGEGDARRIYIAGSLYLVGEIKELLADDQL